MQSVCLVGVGGVDLQYSQLKMSKLLCYHAFMSRLFLEFCSAMFCSWLPGPTLSLLSCFSDLDDIPEAPAIDDSQHGRETKIVAAPPKLETTQLGHWRVNSALLDVLDIAHKEAAALGHFCISEEATATSPHWMATGGFAFQTLYW